MPRKERKAPHMQGPARTADGCKRPRRKPLPRPPSLPWEIASDGACLRAGHSGCFVFLATLAGPVPRLDSGKPGIKKLLEGCNPWPRMRCPLTSDAVEEPPATNPVGYMHPRPDDCLGRRESEKLSKNQGHGRLTSFFGARYPGR